ncbi:MAG: hypothetical protein B6I38_02200 [Anaerolineaceae bacterium 4572_5.1]|nr:MAG: hypothetical protein B6I38_02200 [Anaerolineaceae bacterium 4572_5.1]
MDTKTLPPIRDFWQNTVQEKDWKKALNSLIASLRKELVFDNLAIYMLGESGHTMEVAYARAIGREKQAGADAAWGENIAVQVLEQDKIVIQTPQNENSETTRIREPYLIGLPLNASGKLIGALLFVRFGGPLYTKEQIHLASMAASIVSYIFEKRALHETIAQLEAVQRQMRLQDDFVSTMSHELRTPLGFIKGYSTTLLREDTTWDEETRREFLTIIDEETDHLTELIQNILESARLQSKTIKMNIQPLRLDALIRDVITRISAHYTTLKTTFSSECSTPILGDSTRLAQVFENLFSNAVKYAPKAKIAITVKPIEDHVEVVFADTGPGVPTKHLPYIFDRFYRVPGHTGRTGTGLGLFICKRIIQAHHGKIWAESRPQEGTTFFIHLPYHLNNSG